MGKKGLELSARFSLITNRLRYCGPKNAYKDFELMLKGEKYSVEKVKEHFRRYEGLYVYLEYIANKSNKKPFDYDVVEAYWLGNSLLDNFDKNDLKNIIKKLIERGLPSHYADNLIKKLPNDMNPTHSFNVFFIGVGMITKSVPTNIMTMNKCILTIGRVLKIKEDTLIASVRPLIINRGVLEYSKFQFEHVEYNKDYFPNLKINDKIAIHWDFACKILSKREEKNLEKYTERNINVLNQSLFFSNAPMK